MPSSSTFTSTSVQKPMSRFTSTVPTTSSHTPSTYAAMPLPVSTMTFSHALDFYSTLLCAGVFYLWHQTPLPSSTAQCTTLYGLSLTQWIRHFLITTKLPLEQFYLALKWIQLLTSRFPKLTKLCRPGSELRVFIASLILTNKYYEDHYISKKSWSKVTEVSLAELNQMEMELLEGLEWNLNLSQDDYIQWMQWVQRLKRYWEEQVFQPHLCLPLSPSLEKMKPAPSPSPIVASKKQAASNRVVATSSSS